MKFRRLQRESVDGERGALISAHSSVNCLNCGAPLTGAFCAACGQRDVPPYPSVRALAQRPGLLTKEYVITSMVGFIATVDAMYEWDIKTDTFDWGEGMRGLFGYTEADIGSAPAWIWGLVHPDDVEHLTETFMAAFNGGADRWQLTYRLRRKDGKYASVEGRAYIVRGEDGAPTRVIGAITDRSQQQSLEEQLRQSQKMEAVGRLAGGIAHDFNNILTVIRMSSEFLLADLPEGHESRHEATEIVKASDRASALTRQLLTFSRHQVLNPRTVVLNEVIAGIQGMIRRVVPENIELRELDPKLDPITADTGQLEQVILNLVINAADAMPGGGRLDIRSSNVEADSAFSPEPRRDGPS